MSSIAFKYNVETDTALDRVVTKLNEAGCKLRRRSSGEQYYGFCLAHEGRKPTLAIGWCENGNVGIKCHRGCKLENVLAAHFLTWDDLRANPLSRPTHLDIPDDLSPDAQTWANYAETMMSERSMRGDMRPTPLPVVPSAKKLGWDIGRSDEGRDKTQRAIKECERRGVLHCSERLAPRPGMKYGTKCYSPGPSPVIHISTAQRESPSSNGSPQPKGVRIASNVNEGYEVSSTYDSPLRPYVTPLGHTYSFRALPAFEGEGTGGQQEGKNISTDPYEDAEEDIQF